MSGSQSNEMLFEGIPEQRRHRFDSYAVEQPLPTRSGAESLAGASDAGSERRRAARVTTLYRSSHSDSDFRQRIVASWRQRTGCDLVLIVECSTGRTQLTEEFADLPMALLSDNGDDSALACAHVHTFVMASLSPLIRSSIAALRKSQRTAKQAHLKRTRDGRPSSVPACAAKLASKLLPTGTRLPRAAELRHDETARSCERGALALAFDPAHVEGAAVLRALRYAYSGDLLLSDANVSETLRACHLLGLQDGLDLCVEYLLHKLQPCNALSICALGNLFNCGRLEERADEFLSENFMQVSEETEWLELESDAVERMLQRDNIKCTSEASVVRALFAWARHSPALSAASSAAPLASPSAIKLPSRTSTPRLPGVAVVDSSTAESDAKRRKKMNGAPVSTTPSVDSSSSSSASAAAAAAVATEDLDESEQEEDRVAAFARMLERGTIRFAHLSDEEIASLGDDMHVSPALHEVWQRTAEWERVRRERRAARAQGSEAETTTSTTADASANEDEAENNDDDDDEEDAVPNLRRYSMARGSVVDDTKCEAVLEGHERRVYAVTQAPDGSIVSGARDNTLRVWRLGPDGQAPPPGTERVVSGHRDRVFGLLCLSSGLVASCSFDGTVRLWNPTTWECARELKGHTSWVVAIAEVAGKLVSGAADNTVRVWNTETGECEKTLESAHDHHVYGVCRVEVQHGGVSKELLATGSQDHSVKFWDPSQDWKLVRTMRGHRSSIRSLKQVGRFLASASADRTIRLWHLEEALFGQPAGKLIGHSDHVETLACVPGAGPGGRPLLASAGHDWHIKLWDCEAKRCVKTMLGHRGWVKSLFVLQSGKLASGSADTTVRIWNLS